MACVCRGCVTPPLYFCERSTCSCTSCFWAVFACVDIFNYDVFFEIRALFVIFFFFFFFQAEDGIRDLIVTGVQTCALPISRAALVERCKRRLERVGFGRERRADARQHRLVRALLVRAAQGVESQDVRRSEERRVGEEGRSRWSPYH